MYRPPFRKNLSQGAAFPLLSRRQNFHECVLCFGPPVTQSFIEAVSLFADDVGAQRDSVQASSAGPILHPTHQRPSDALAALGRINNKPQHLSSRLSQQRFFHNGVRPTHNSLSTPLGKGIVGGAHAVVEKA